MLALEGDFSRRCPFSFPILLKFESSFSELSFPSITAGEEGKASNQEAVGRQWKLVLNFTADMSQGTRIE